MFNSTFIRKIACLFSIGTLLILNACDHREVPNPALVPDVTIYLLNDQNQLIQTNARNSSTQTATVGLTGLQVGEKILDIDFRPATGQLYGISNQSRTYFINTKTGSVKAVGSSFLPGLDGTAIGIDFSPFGDRIRVVTNKGQNLRINPETGVVQAIDGKINSSTINNPTVTAIAYSNNRVASAETKLYDIDPISDRLYVQNLPIDGRVSDGKVSDIGPLGLDISAVSGFDIAPSNDQTLSGIAAVTFAGRSELQQVNVRTGRMQKLGDLPGNIIGLAIPTWFTAYSIDDNNFNISVSPNPFLDDPTQGGCFNCIVGGITGTEPGEILVGIDFRPADGRLYALGSKSRLYTVNLGFEDVPAQTRVTLVGALNVPLDGTSFGFDFNPTADRIRIVSNTGQNLRVNPNDVTVTVDTPLNGATNKATASAYTNNFLGASSTTLYNIDSSTGSLYIQNPPNNGTQALVGSLGIPNFESAAGFDIGGVTGKSYAILRANGLSNLQTIDLNTGKATLLPGFGFGNNQFTVFRGFAVGLGF